MVMGTQNHVSPATLKLMLFPEGFVLNSKIKVCMKQYTFKHTCECEKTKCRCSLGTRTPKEKSHKNSSRIQDSLGEAGQGSILRQGVAPHSDCSLIPRDANTKANFFPIQ